MLLYIHGFRTTKNSHKAKLLQAHYQEHIIISDHSVIPSQAIEDLEKIIENKKITGIIASSLGGFYATYLSEKYKLKTVLINPSVKPYETTDKYLGENTKDNGEKFIWEKEHLTMLEKFKVNQSDLTPSNFFLFLQTGDEVLDYNIALEHYHNSKLILEEDGNHRFSEFERFFDDVSLFLEPI
ncbi:MAG: hypothetical protein K0U38_11885 [Epsilonproteobacteria bacterium]|nr:hypothetical protein [Campylobacterota bacterium]